MTAAEDIYLSWSRDDKDLWTVCRPVYFKDDVTDIVVPEGFKTDLASVPRIFWSLIPRSGRYTRAAIIHDYLYDKGLVSRARADAIFLSQMRKDGVVVWKRLVMYMAVRGFGWRGFKDSEKS